MNNGKESLRILIQQIKALDGIYRYALKDLDVSINEFWIWYALIVMNEEYSQQDISQLLGVPKQTVNNIISSMVKKGYIMQESVSGTKHRKKICLTDSGKAYGESIVKPVWEAEQKAYDRLPEAEKKYFSEILEHFSDYLKEELYQQ